MTGRGQDLDTIVVVGSTMVDLFAFAARLPDAGETVVGERFLQGFGGKGANQAVMAARFGGPVALVGAVGTDANGAAIVANLAEHGVSTEAVAIVPGTSGVASIWVDGAGMNRIIVIPGTNLGVDPGAASEAVKRLRPVVVLGQFEIPQPVTAAAFRAARDVGAITILNPAPGAPIDRELRDATDWLVPNETEFAAIGGGRLTGQEGDEDRLIDSFAAEMAISVIVTLGPRGVALRPISGPLQRIAAPSVRAVDTTGAGDAFVGAFAVGLARGLAPDAAARLGCAAASDSVRRSGTQASYPDADAAQTMWSSVATRPSSAPRRDARHR